MPRFAPVLLFATLMASTALAGPAPGFITTTEAGAKVYGGPAFRHDSSIDSIVVGADDVMWTVQSGTVRGWSIPEGTVKERFDVPCDAYQYSLALSDDGQRMAIACEEEGIVIVDREGVAQKRMAANDATDLVWSGDLLAGRIDDTFVLWSISKDKELARVPVAYDASWRGHDGNIALIGALSRPNGSQQHLAMFNSKGEEVWRVPVGSQHGVSWSVDGSVLAVAESWDLCFRDAKTGKQQECRFADSSVRASVATPAGWWVLVDDEIHVLDASLEEVARHPGTPVPWTAAPDGRWVVVPEGTRPSVFAADGQAVHGDHGLAEDPTELVSGGDKIVAFDDSGFLVIDRSTGAHQRTAMADVNVVAITPDGSIVAIGANRLWLRDPEGLHLVEGIGPDLSVDAMVFSSDGSKLWVVDDYGERLSEIDVANRRLKRSRKLPEDGINSIFVLHDRSGIVMPLEDGRLSTIEF